MEGGDKRAQKRIRREYLQHVQTNAPAEVLGLDESDNIVLGPDDIPMDSTFSLEDIEQPPSGPLLTAQELVGRTSGSRVTQDAGPSFAMPKAHLPIPPHCDEPEEQLRCIPEALCDITVVKPGTVAQLTANDPSDPDNVSSVPDVKESGIDEDHALLETKNEPAFSFEKPDDMSWAQWSIDTEKIPFHFSDISDSVREDCGEQEQEEPFSELSTEGLIIKEDSPIYDGAPISQWDSLTSILSFAQSEHISGAGLSRLISLIALHLPDPNMFFKSSHHLFKMLDKIDEPVVVHYFCSICFKLRPTSTDLCDVCLDETRKVNYFISVPLASQLKKMMQRPDFVADLNYKTNRDKEHSNNIEDILDGDIYKDADTGSPLNLTAMWNTDGLQIFNSSSFSLWPFFLVINELPPHKRFLSENILIAGLWGSVTKPHPNVFLLPIYKDIHQTLEKGFECNVYGMEEKCTVKVKVLCGTCDAPARATFLNMKYYSGFYSCPVCLCKGEKSKRTGDVTVFPFEENVRLRCEDEYQEQVKWAVQNKVLHNKALQNEEGACGIKGPSVLSHFVNNMFQSTSIDVMHCVYLGVTRQMLQLMTDDKDAPYSILPKITEVNSRMLQMSPPHFVQRLPQSVEKLLLWKASELRNFLLYYALCVLQNILSQKYFDHLMLLVEGISLLNKSSISHEDITLASLLLCQFVQQFQELYGIRHMSHNLHMLLHLPLNVKNLGPLWATSCFKFEDMNGRLTNLVHGARHAGLQIYSHLSVVTQLPLLINKLKNKTVQSYCKQIFSKGKPLHFSDKVSSGIHCIGNMTALSDEFTWIVLKLLELFNINVQPSSIKLFQRLLKHNLLYVSSAYPPSKRNSSFIRYNINNITKYGVIETFARIKDCTCTGNCECVADYVAIVKPIDLSPAFFNNTVKVHHIFTVIPSTSPREIVYVECLSTVVFTINFQNNVFIAEPLNKFELE